MCWPSWSFQGTTWEFHPQTEIAVWSENIGHEERNKGCNDKGGIFTILPIHHGLSDGVNFTIVMH